MVFDSGCPIDYRVLKIVNPEMSTLEVLRRIDTIQTGDSAPCGRASCAGISALLDDALNGPPVSECASKVDQPAAYTHKIRPCSDVPESESSLGEV